MVLDPRVTYYITLDYDILIEVMPYYGPDMVQVSNDLGLQIVRLRNT